MGHVGSPLLLDSTLLYSVSLCLIGPGAGVLVKAQLNYTTLTLMQASKAGCCEIKTAVETVASTATATAIKLKGSGSKTLQKMQAAKVKGKNSHIVK